jgi:thioredoxin reductase (NADPH)
MPDLLKNVPLFAGVPASDSGGAPAGIMAARARPYLLEPRVPGIFAVGGARHGSLKRVASDVGEGSMAIAFVHQY